jgi:hypothetical protein
MAPRKESGRQLLKDARRIDDKNYNVKSYSILATTIGWSCSCPDHKFSGVKSKQVYAVEFNLELQKAGEIRNIVEVVLSGCKYCKSDVIVKCGLRKKQTC